MARRIRRFRGHTIYELTVRTEQGRFAFVPKECLKKELIGIFDEGLSRWAVQLYHVIFMSNHAHLFVSADDANQMGCWASFVFAQSARAAQHHHGLKGRIWGRRYHAAEILDDETLYNRLAYLMAQACCEKNDLVEAPRHWPGLNCSDALCRGEALEGFYLTAELRRKALRDGKTMTAAYGNTAEHRRVLKLTPLPGLPEAEHARQAWYRRLEKEIIEAARERRAGKGLRCPHPSAYCEVDPNAVPKNFQATPAPACHTACPQLRHEFRTGWRHFVALWSEAMERFKRGLAVCFPAGGWRPFGCKAVLPEARQLE